MIVAGTSRGTVLLLNIWIENCMYVVDSDSSTVIFRTEI